MRNTTSTLKIAIIGYGSQGRAHALNLRDSGFDIIVGLRPGGPTEAKAQVDGFTVQSPDQAAKHADLVAVLTPDMVQKKLYEEVLAPNIKQGACLLFAHGLNVHYSMITPRSDLDVVLVAPRVLVHWYAANTKSDVGCHVSMQYIKISAAMPSSWL